MVVAVVVMLVVAVVVLVVVCGSGGCGDVDRGGGCVSSGVW